VRRHLQVQELRVSLRRGLGHGEIRDVSQKILHRNCGLREQKRK